MAKGMWLSEDVISEANDLKSVDTVKVLGCGKAAIATYTSHEKFTYKGTVVSARARDFFVLRRPARTLLTSDASLLVRRTTTLSSIR